LARKVTPDASLIADESYTATDSAGLRYPFEGNTPGNGTLVRVTPSLSWARIPMPGSLGHINSWLPDDHDGVAVVDTGMRLTTCADEWKALFKGPLKGRKVTRVIGTHLHPDHIGLAGWLCKKGDVELWMTRGEMLTARMLMAEVKPEQPPEVAIQNRACGWSEEDIARSGNDGWGKFAMVTHPLPLGYRRLQDDDRVDFGAVTWRVVTGNGHSPEHACLWDETNGVLISGDQVLPKISSNVSVNLTEPHADPLGDWLDSIQKLLGILPDDLLVCPAHGDPFYGLHWRLNALWDEHHQRLERLTQFLKTPARVIDCFGQLFNREITIEHSMLATGEALAHLHRLEIMGHVTRETRDNVWWFSAV